ncbi:MAG: tail protein X [Selenomonadaceae bacterium]|nr:tail protein X [Selenomonadaceae bacterium]
MWDLIAYKVYGKETCMDKLIQANTKYMNIAVFPQGIKLNCPELKTEDRSFLPPWRR